MTIHDTKLSVDRRSFPQQAQRLATVMDLDGDGNPFAGTGTSGTARFDLLDRSGPSSGHRDQRRSRVWIVWAALLVMVVTFWVFALIGIAYTLGFLE